MSYQTQVELIFVTIVAAAGLAFYGAVQSISALAMAAQ